MKTLKDLKSEEEHTGYHVVLKNYDGPLDLLLDMVKRAKIRIEDIFISDITEQYLAAMEQLDELDMEQAADFIEVAATLLEIKSRALLPRPEVVETPEEDPKAQLIQRIDEYRIYKEAAEKMREREIINMHYRAPDESVGQPRLVLKDMSTEGLVKALRKMFDKLGVKQSVIKTRKIENDPFTVAQKITFIRDRMRIRERVNFDELFDEDFTVNEIITTFQALLELLKAQEVEAEQADTFETITIIRKNITDRSLGDGD